MEASLSRVKKETTEKNLKGMTPTAKHYVSAVLHEKSAGDYY
jgi:hypothetical protein